MDYQSVYGFVAVDVKNLPFLHRFYRNTLHDDNHDLNAIGNQPPWQHKSK